MKIFVDHNQEEVAHLVNVFDEYMEFSLIIVVILSLNKRLVKKEISSDVYNFRVHFDTKTRVLSASCFEIKVLLRVIGKMLDIEAPFRVFT